MRLAGVFYVVGEGYFTKTQRRDIMPLFYHSPGGGQECREEVGEQIVVAGVEEREGRQGKYSGS